MNTHSIAAFSVIEPLEPRIVLAADLVIENIDVSMPDPAHAIPGDPVTVRFDVVNNGPDRAVGTTGSHVYMQLITGGTKTRVGAFENMELNLAADKSAHFTALFKLPAAVLPAPQLKAGMYRFIVEADSGFRIAEGSNEGNNNTPAPDQFDFNYEFAFGDVGARSNVILSTSDGDGTTARFSVSGVGSGRLQNDPTVPLANNILHLKTTDTTATSSLFVFTGTAGDGRIDLGSVNVPDPLKRAALRNVNLARDATFANVAEVQLGDVGIYDLVIPPAEQTLTIGGTKPVVVKLARTRDAILDSTVGIATLQAAEWREFNGIGDTITAPFFGAITIGGPLEADIKATGGNADKFGIRSLEAKSVSGGTKVEAPMAGIGKIKVDEWLGGGEIAAEWVKTIITRGNADSAVAGDFSAKVTVTGPNFIPKTRSSLSSATIAGAITGGTWSAAGDIGTLEAASIAAAWLLDGAEGATGATGGTHVEQITVKGAMGGMLEAVGYDVIRVGGELTAQIKATGDSQLVPLLTLEAGSATGANITALTGNVSRISVAEWHGGSIQAQSLTVLTAIGDPARQVRGDLANVQVTLTGAGFVARVSAAGSISNLIFTAPESTSIDEVRAEEWIGGSLDVGEVTKFNITGDAKGGVRGDLRNVNVTLRSQFADLSLNALTVRGVIDQSTFDLSFGAGKVLVGAMLDSTFSTSGKNIGTLLLTGVAGLAGPAFDATDILAGTIARLTVRDVNEVVSGNPYGIQAKSVGRYVRITADEPGEIMAPLTTPGVKDNAGDYSLTIIP